MGPAFSLPHREGRVKLELLIGPALLQSMLLISWLLQKAVQVLRRAQQASFPPPYGLLFLPPGMADCAAFRLNNRR